MAAVMASSPALAQKDDSAFFSIFPKTDFSTPTPESTPNIGSLTSPGAPFGGPNVPLPAADQAVRLSRAWSSATRFLTLTGTLGNEVSSVNAEFNQALQIVLVESETISKDLLDWYSHETGIHFRSVVLPELHRWKDPVAVSQARELVDSTIQILQQARKLYLGRLEAVESRCRNATVHQAITRFINRTKRNLDVLRTHSLPAQRLQATLAAVMFDHMQSYLDHNANPERCVKDARCHCTLSTGGFPFAQLFDVGLGGALGERAFALAVHRFLSGPAIERRCFAVDWNGAKPVVERLRGWVDSHFNPVAKEALQRLTGDAEFELPAQDKKQFDLLAVTSLGRLRAASLFDYVKSWPDSTGAILDIKAYLAIKEPIGSGLPSEKAFVCQSFIEQIQTRFLHAGATTSEILSVYINVINAFKTLDARGVLLGRVAAPVRNYLRTREDTVSVIAASFLADVDHDGNATAADLDKICPDIALEVINSTLDENRDHKLLNWDDPDWVPDPIDAEPDYRSSKSDDVVAQVLGLFEQDEFIKEVTAVLAQQLLQSADSEYVKETRLVELLKSRLDATKLQAAEVMLKDVRDSVSLGKRLNPAAIYESRRTLAAPTPKEIQEAIPEDGITTSSLYDMFSQRMRRAEFLAVAKLVSTRRQDLLLPKRTRLPAAPSSSSTKAPDAETPAPLNFKTQIVSSFFWPQLRTDEFLMPAALDAPLQTFHRRFANIGSQRKLHFRPALARVSLRLELEDRVVEESDLPGWRASVIDAFTDSAAAAMTAVEGSQGGVEVDPSSDPPAFTAEQLATRLEMEQDLVIDALAFWTAKRVLYQPQRSGAYAVLESLDMDLPLAAPGDDEGDFEDDPDAMDIAAAAAAAVDAPVSAVRSQDALLRESAPMFQIFIANMLRNGGAKAVEGPMGITAVLRMVNPTFTYGEEEVLWLLGEMEGRGEVRREGDVWAAC